MPPTGSDGDRQLDGRWAADRLEHVVGAAVGQVSKGRGGLGGVLAGEQRVGGAERARDIELRRDPVDRHDP